MRGVRRIHAGLGVLAFFPIFWVPARQSDPSIDYRFCSIRTLHAPIGHAEVPTLLRVLALADTVVTHSRVNDEWARFATGVNEEGAVGQLFQVIEVAGPNRGELAPGDTVAVVPWQYVADCSRTRWSSSSRWVAPGSEGVFSFPASAMRDQPPVTFDVLGWHWPYPHGRFLRFAPYGEEPVNPQEWLTPGEMFALWAVLPIVQWSDTDPDSVMPAIRDIFNANARFRETFPGDRILEDYEMWARNR